MIQHLEEAKSRSADPEPEVGPPQAVNLEYTGRPGRPRIVIDEEILEEAHTHRGPTGLASAFGTSARTVRRRLLEAGLAEPGDPVYVDFMDNDGNEQRYYTGLGHSTAESDLSDDELDGIMEQILAAFPTFGRRMIDGELRFMGHIVPRSRIQASYGRVYGPPVNAFGVRRIQRRVYSVRGFNSLWHHDGQHGMSMS